jgi:hypothetical protein
LFVNTILSSDLTHMNISVANSLKIFSARSTKNSAAGEKIQRLRKYTHRGIHNAKWSGKSSMRSYNFCRKYNFLVQNQTTKRFGPFSVLFLICQKFRPRSPPQILSAPFVFYGRNFGHLTNLINIITSPLSEQLPADVQSCGPVGAACL